MNNSNIQRNVMRRIRIIQKLRPLMSGRVAALLVAVVALWEIGREVFVAQIIANLASVSNPAALLQFISAALLNTTFVVQVLVGVCAIAFVWFVVDGIHSIRSSRRFA